MPLPMQTWSATDVPASDGRPRSPVGAATVAIDKGCFAEVNGTETSISDRR